MAFWQWSRTPASNATADPTLNWAVGMAPSAVGASSRAEMARLAEFRDDTSGLLVTVGTATAYSVTTFQGLNATPNDGQLLSFKAHVASGASATLQADNGNFYPLQQVSGTALPTNIIVASGKYDVSFDANAAAWILKGYSPPTNLTAVTVSGTPTVGHLTEWAAPTIVTDAGIASDYLDISGTGMNAPLNLSLTATVSANVLTVTFLAASSGLGPTTTNPVLMNFGDATLAAGDPTLVSLTASAAISTVVGGTLGAPNSSVPFAHWIVAFNNGGTVVPALINCSTSAAVFALNDSLLQSTTGMSAGATSAGVFYTPAATSLTNKAFRIVGYLDYASGLVTAGTYNNPPTAVRLFGPGVKKPGDIVNGTFTAGTSLAITPTRAINLVKVSAVAGVTNGSSATIGMVLQRNAGTIQTSGGLSNNGTANQVNGTFPFYVYDNPASVSAQTYTFSGSNCSAAANRSTITLEEIMG